MSNRFKAVGLFCRALWGESSLPCRPILQFFSENFNFFLLFSECFQFPRSQFPVGCGDFLFFPAVFILFSSFPFYTYYKEDFHYEHHYRHRPRLLCYQNSPLLVPGRATSYGEHEPYTRQGLLEFGGCFFVCGSGRQPIQRDKTVNDNYYLLTLAAIAKEIRQRGLPPECLSLIHI